MENGMWMNVSVHLASFVKKKKVGKKVVFDITFVALDVISSLNLAFTVFLGDLLLGSSF